MFELVIRFLFFFTVLLGLTEFYFIKLKVKNEFIPIILFSSIGLIIFSAGILNIMLEVLICIVLFGLGYLIYSFMKKKFTLKFITPGVLFFLLFSVYLAFFLRGAQFEAYDDFSHWGLVAREILATNRFPNFESLIMFQAYPTGSASFIYFVSKIIGDTEGVMLYAQSLLTLSCIIPLFAFINKKNIVSYIIIFMSSIFFLTSNVGFLALSVDTLLAMLSLGCSAVIIYGYNKQDYKLVYLQILPVLTFLIIIKNSGIFFVLVNVLLLLYYSIKFEASMKQNMKKLLITISVPYIFTVLWKKHVQLVFSQGFETKHAMSIESYQKIFQEKTIFDIKLIITSFIKRSMDWNQIEIKIYLLCLVGFLSIYLLTKTKFLNDKHGNDSGLKLFFCSLVLYFVYQIGLLSTYVFSMPLSEAFKLASYQRYNMTIIMYIFGVLLIYLLSILNNSNISFVKPYNKLVFSISILLIIMVPPLYWKYPAHNSILEKKDYSQKDRYALETMYNKNGLVPNESYVVYLSDQSEINRASYFYHVALYELRSSNIKIITQKEIDQISSDGEIKYLIVLRDDKLINEKLSGMGINQYQKLIQLN